MYTFIARSAKQNQPNCYSKITCVNSVKVAQFHYKTEDFAASEFRQHNRYFQTKTLPLSFVCIVDNK